MNYRRDFLRENKLSLRELQKVTTNKQTKREQDQQQKSQKQQQQHQQKNLAYVSQHNQIKGRSLSQQRIAPAIKNNQNTINPNPNHSNFSNIKRSLSQQRGMDQYSQSTDERGMDHTSQYSDHDVRTEYSQASRTESVDKQIQTEDITDEEFLYDALKKCSTSEIAAPSCTMEAQKKAHMDCSSLNIGYNHTDSVSHRHQKMNRADQDINHSLRPNCYDGDNSQPVHQTVRSTQFHQSQNYNYNPSANLQHSMEAQIQGHCSSLNIGHNHTDSASNHRHQKLIAADQDINSCLRPNCYHMNYDSSGHLQDINNGVNGLAMDNDVEPPESARSRQTHDNTDHSNLSNKRSNGSLHKFGSREDIRLPRYLEKEKREKEEQRLKELERDPNCPFGHFALSEEERLAALSAAEKKFKALVNELNHMPMTAETLRIRTRKAEIERELSIIEADMRVFKKPKVYVKQE